MLLLIWRFKNGKEVKTNAKCVLSVDKDVVTLTLKNTELNDAGTYKCEASNKLGTVNAECTVEVQGIVFSFVSYLQLTTASSSFPVT